MDEQPTKNEQVRTKQIGVIVNDHEYEAVRKLAFKHGRSMSAFLRDLALGHVKIETIDRDAA